MAESQPELFNCPNCGAEYKVVRVEAPVGDTFHEITCNTCGGRLEGREARSVLKYFLVSRRGA
jgi:transcription elongation factor Elf1